MQKEVKSFSDEINDKLSDIDRIDLSHITNEVSFTRDLKYKIANLFDVLEVSKESNSDIYRLDCGSLDWHVNYKDFAETTVPSLFGKNQILETTINKLKEKGLWEKTFISFEKLRESKAIFKYIGECKK
jgi:hypothetical protein